MTRKHAPLGLGLALLTTLAAGAAVTAAYQATQSEDDPDPERFAGEFDAFEEADDESMPAPGAVVFTGSSSIRRWDLGASFPELEALNRGFGGSHLSDVAAVVDRFVLPYSPSVVVLYAGDNDVAAGKPAEQVVEDFRDVVDRLREGGSEATVLFLSIKPSPARWHLWGVMQEANALVADTCTADDRLVFVDVATPLLGENGEPRPDCYVGDGLHLSPAGYAAWTEVLAPDCSPTAARVRSNPPASSRIGGDGHRCPAGNTRQLMPYSLSFR